MFLPIFPSCFRYSWRRTPFPFLGGARSFCDLFRRNSLRSAFVGHFPSSKSPSCCAFSDGDPFEPDRLFFFPAGVCIFDLQFGFFGEGGIILSFALVSFASDFFSRVPHPFFLIVVTSDARMPCTSRFLGPFLLCGLRPLSRCIPFFFGISRILLSESVCLALPWFFFRNREEPCPVFFSSFLFRGLKLPLEPCYSEKELALSRPSAMSRKKPDQASNPLFFFPPFPFLLPDLFKIAEDQRFPSTPPPFSPPPLCDSTKCGAVF